MGSYEYDTQQTNPTGKSNHAATDVADTEEVKKLKTQYKNELKTLQELFEDWTEADLLFALQEASGDLDNTIARISQ
ncbi:7774_t:CDS:1, partial [Acaulospora morrowiae]